MSNFTTISESGTKARGQKARIWSLGWERVKETRGYLEDFRLLSCSCSTDRTQSQETFPLIAFYWTPLKAPFPSSCDTHHQQQHFKHPAALGSLLLHLFLIRQERHPCWGAGVHRSSPAGLRLMFSTSWVDCQGDNMAGNQCSYREVRRKKRDKKMINATI